MKQLEISSQKIYTCLASFKNILTSHLHTKQNKADLNKS